MRCIPEGLDASSLPYFPIIVTLLKYFSIVEQDQKSIFFAHDAWSHWCYVGVASELGSLE